MLLGGHGLVCQGLLHHLAQVHVGRCGRGSAVLALHALQAWGRALYRALGFLPRQCQQLFDEPCGPVYAGRKTLHGLVMRGHIGRPLQGHQLQLERGQRRAQLVRGIGHEVLLRLKGLAHALQQRVELGHQGPHLVGQALGRHGGQVLRAARGQFAAHALHGRQRTAHHPPHGQRQHGRQQGNGQQALPGGVARQGAAHAHVLRHLDHLRARLQREHAVDGAARGHIGKAQHGHLRQCRTQRGFENAQAFVGPDLDDKFVVLILGRRALRPAARIHRQAGAQRKGGLLHLVVEQGVGLQQRIAVGQQALQQRREHDGRAQEQEQPRAQCTGQAAARPGDKGGNKGGSRRLHGLGTM